MLHIVTNNWTWTNKKFFWKAFWKNKWLGCYQDWTVPRRLKGPRVPSPSPKTILYIQSSMERQLQDLTDGNGGPQETGLSDCSFITLMNCWQNIRSMKVHQQRQRSWTYTVTFLVIPRTLQTAWPLGVVCRLYADSEKLRIKSQVLFWSK